MKKTYFALALFFLITSLFGCTKNVGDQIQPEEQSSLPNEKVTLVIDVVNENGESFFSPETKDNWIGEYLTCVWDFDRDYSPAWLSWIIGAEYDPSVKFPSRMWVEEINGRPYCIITRLYPILGLSQQLFFIWPREYEGRHNITLKFAYEDQPDGSKKQLTFVYLDEEEVGTNFTITLKQAQES